MAHDSYRQLTTIADSLHDIASRLGESHGELGEVAEIDRLARALQIEITFLLPTPPRTEPDAIAQRWFEECCEPSTEYLTDDDDATEHLDLWVQAHELRIEQVWPDYSGEVPRWVRINYPPTATGDARNRFRYPFALKPAARAELERHRAEVAAEQERREKIREQRQKANERLLPPWFERYKKTLPDIVRCRDVYRAAIDKGLKRKYLLNQGVVNALMRNAGFARRGGSYWERRA